jgi:hypothetical protein
MYSGDYRSIAMETGAWVEEARRREDRYAFAALTGFGAGGLRHVVAGRPQEAVDEVARAMLPWPKTYFSVLHFGAFCVTAQARVAAADPEFFAWLEREDATYRRPIFMRAPTCRLAFHLMRLNALLVTPEAHAQPRSQEVLAKGRREVRALAGNQSQPAAGVAALARAVLHAREGHAEKALLDAEAAGAALKISGHCCERGATFLTGWLRGGDAGRETCAAVLSSFSDEGFVDPRQGLALCLPGAFLFS